MFVTHLHCLTISPAEYTLKENVVIIITIAQSPLGLCYNLNNRFSVPDKCTDFCLVHVLLGA